jgi:hypothetical protein
MRQLSEWWQLLQSKEQLAEAWVRYWVHQLQILEWIHFLWSRLVEWAPLFLAQVQAVSAWFMPKLFAFGQHVFDQLYQALHSDIMQALILKLFHPENIVFWLVLGAIAYLPILWRLCRKPIDPSTYVQ